MLDELGGPKTYNHYPNGWAMAFNTPFKMWKRYEFNGGTSDPCIISWPAGMQAKGEIREQYHHAVDLVPTVLDALGIEAPATIKGHTQSHFDGVSMRYSFDDPTAPGRAADAVLLDARVARHLARRLEGHHHPPDDQRLGQLQRRRVGALPRRRRPLRAAQPGGRAPRQAPRDGQPLVRRGRRQRGLPARRPLGAGDPRRHPRPQLSAPRDRYVYFPQHAEVPESQAVVVRGRSFVIGALVDLPEPGAQGVLFSHGSRFGGHSLYVKDNRLHYVNSFVGHVRADGRRHRGPAHRREPHPVGLVREGRHGPAAGGHRHPVPLPRRHQGRRGPDQAPARQLHDRRRGPGGRSRRR